MALDLGEKTIGVAVSDDLGWTAQPLTTLKRKSPREDVDEIVLLVEEHRVDQLVVGLPVNMDGTMGHQARRVLSFVESMKQRLKVPVITWDERLSTVAVERVLLEADVSRRKRKQHIDKLAAAYILQGYLDSQPRS
ncbi:MAG: Holliday junction resolvase RuvX [bacterium]